MKRFKLLFDSNKVFRKPWRVCEENDLVGGSFLKSFFTKKAAEAYLAVIEDYNRMLPSKWFADTWYSVSQQPKKYKEYNYKEDCIHETELPW